MRIVHLQKQASSDAAAEQSQADSHLIGLQVANRADKDVGRLPANPQMSRQKQNNRERTKSLLLHQRCLLALADSLAEGLLGLSLLLDRADHFARLCAHT